MAIICIVLSFLTKTTFKANLLHILNFEFGGKERRMIGDILSGDNLSKMIHLIHRNAIEDVKEHKNDGPRKNNEMPNCSDSVVEGQRELPKLEMRQSIPEIEDIGADIQSDNVDIENDNAAATNKTHNANDKPRPPETELTESGTVRSNSEDGSGDALKSLQ